MFDFFDINMFFQNVACENGLLFVGPRRCKGCVTYAVSRLADTVIRPAPGCCGSGKRKDATVNRASHSVEGDIELHESTLVPALGERMYS